MTSTKEMQSVDSYLPISQKPGSW